jgi:uncharacterized protein (TIRG00374 family)
MAKGLRYVINAVISIFLIILIIYLTGIKSISTSLASMSLSLFLLAIVIENLGVMVSAKKWHILLKAKKVHVSFFTAWKYYYYGTFFNAFLPTTVGGDVIKAYGLSRRLNRKEDAFSSVVMDRLSGLVAVIMIGSVAIIVGWQVIPRAALALSLLILIGPLTLILLIFTTDVVGRLLRWPVVKKLGRMTTFADQVYVSLRGYRHNRRFFLPVLMISLLYHTLLVINNYVLSRALSLDIPLYYFFIFIPVAEILVFLPITIQGFGVREGTYVLLFSSIGVRKAQAFALGFSDQLVKLSGNIIGGVVYVLTSWRR